MSEQWEIEGCWEDYYKILQIDPSADPETIDTVYKGLMKRYHPDPNIDKDTTEESKKINVAYSILKNPDKRRKYDAAYRLRQNQAQDQSSEEPKPQLVFNPSEITVTKAEPNKPVQAKTIVKNLGGSSSNISIEPLISHDWIELAEIRSVNGDNDFPWEIVLSLTGVDWETTYQGHFGFVCDQEQFTLLFSMPIKLVTKTQPVVVPHKASYQPKPVGTSTQTRSKAYAQTSSNTQKINQASGLGKTKQSIQLGLCFLALLIFFPFTIFFLSFLADYMSFGTSLGEELVLIFPSLSQKMSASDQENLKLKTVSGVLGQDTSIDPKLQTARAALETDQREKMLAAVSGSQQGVYIVKPLRNSKDSSNKPSRLRLIEPDANRRDDIQTDGVYRVSPNF